MIFGLVLAIACANVAGLLLARGAARRREIAIRLAIGASRWRVMGTLLSESLVLSGLGSLAGLLLTFWLCRVIRSIPLPQAPGPLEVTPDLSVILYGVALAAVTAIACGLTPALAASNPRLTDAMRQDAGAHWRQLRGRRALVVGQVALSAVLLFVSTLFLRSLMFIGTVEPGFDLENVVTVHIDLERERPQEQRTALALRLKDAVTGAAGVTSASIANLIPLGGDMYEAQYQVDGGAASAVRAYYMNVGPDYFRTMGTRLRLGREFEVADRTGAPPVAIVNEAFLRAYGVGMDAARVRVRKQETEPWREVVGVVADSKYGLYGETPHPIVYQPYLQAGGNLWMVARVPGEPAAAVRAVRRAIDGVDPSVRAEARTLRETTNLEFSIRRMGSWLLGALGGLGLALALVGLYGLMSYTAHRRAAEIGVRLAMGAPRGAILWMVLRSGIRQVAVGVALGIAISLAVARPLAFLMSGITTTDPVTIAATAALLLSAGLAASYFPARRATLVDPMVSLRGQ